MTDPRSFGSWLRRERERRAITLRTIADRTKIGSGLLEALERGDVSRWPGGIYRRAFVRSYAEAVGLDPDLVVANFERVFPAEGVKPAEAAASRAAQEEDGMRLELAMAPPQTVPAGALRKAGIDLGAIAGFAIAGWFGAGAVGLWCAAAVAAVVIHLSRVLGFDTWSVRLRSRPARQVQPAATAQVINFSPDQVRSPSRRARAQRVLASLSAAATSAAIPGRRRAARS